MSAPLHDDDPAAEVETPAGVVRNLTPAEHVVPAPEGGWRGADLSDAELVDDAHIEADPTSQVLKPLQEFSDGA